MKRTAEFVSLGHPDKTADYISSYVLDQMILQDKDVKYAVEVLIKDNTVVLGGEIKGSVDLSLLEHFVKEALRNIGYDEKYALRWGDYAININKIKIISLIGQQSAEINQGVVQNGWGDQGVFVGYACQGEGLINRELYLAKTLNQALYRKALQSDNLGLDIKTQVTLNEQNKIETVVVAVPMLKPEELTDFVIEVLKEKPNNIIINGTGVYKYHSAIADCGITGRKLACDFYSTASPIGGGSPWTKDGSKADLTLNLYARKLAIDYLQDNDECFVFLSSCIGRSQLPSAVVKKIKDNVPIFETIVINKTPRELIEQLNLNTPIFAKLCSCGLIN